MQGRDYVGKDIAAEFAMKSSAMSYAGNALFSIGLVWVDTNLGFFPSPRWQWFWNTHPF